jgi:hypothetical protein
MGDRCPLNGHITGTAAEAGAGEDGWTTGHDEGPYPRRVMTLASLMPDRQTPTTGPKLTFAPATNA